jgi:hypothetical protein
LRRHVNGSGMMRARKRSISVTKRRKTWKHNKSKHGGHIAGLAVRIGKGHASSDMAGLPLGVDPIVAARDYLDRNESCLPDCSRASFWLCCCSLVGRAGVYVWAGLGGNNTRDEVSCLKRGDRLS